MTTLITLSEMAKERHERQSIREEESKTVQEEDERSGDEKNHDRETKQGKHTCLGQNK